MDKPKNYATSSKVVEKALGVYTQIREGFKEEKKKQNDLIDECWDIYNCVLGDAQMYEGESQIFEPIVRDAVEARRKRFTAMLFPQVGNNIQCVSETGEQPAEVLAILQRHVSKSDLRSVLSSMLLAGDVEGQWSLMLDWKEIKRKVTKKAWKPVDEGATEDIVDVDVEEVTECGPTVRVLPAQDLWVFPSTVSKIDQAEMVAVALRLTDNDLDEMVEAGMFTQSGVDKIVRDAGEDSQKWADKSRSADAGIKIKSGRKFCLVYMVFMRLKLDGEKQSAIVFFGGPQNVIGIVKNPYWCGKVPIISAPVDRVPGSFWGKSKVEPVRMLAYQLNDITNMGMDSAQYSLLPIVMTDPVKNPRVGSMVMGKAAIWETSPQDTKFVEFPQLYQHAVNLRNVVKQQIMESMEVNETMLGKAPQGRKNAQAIAAQSTEALATIGDVARRVENEILNPLLEWFYELDVQFRDDDLWVTIEGEHGIQAKMQRLAPQQVNERYHFRWLGMDQTTGAQRTQQMIAMMNVLRGVPPQQLNGRRLDVGPILDFVSATTFGPTMSQNILIDERHKMLIPPAVEVEMLLNGFDVAPNPLDNHVEHLQALQQASQQTGDPTGVFRKQMQARMQMLQAQMPQGQQGAPGGAGPGIAGTPRPGAMPSAPRGGQNPPGAIHADQMMDPRAQPRG
jgi:hypothetical protein